MFTSRLVLASFLTLATASLTPDTLFATLLKRQAPGTPEYACHDNCGTAITVSKVGGDYCTDEVFLYDYNNCLQCAGPDNVDIWKYYGGSLTTAAGKCSGLDTEPKSGKQDDVGDAKHPSDSSSAAASSAPTSTAEAVTEPATTTAAAVTDVASSSAPESTTAASESSAVASLSSAVESAVSSAISSVLETATAIPVPTASGAPYITGNGTSNATTPTSSPPAEFSGSAEKVQVRNVVALIGAVAAVGAFY